MALNLKEFISRVEIKEPLVVDNLTLYPLTAGRQRKKNRFPIFCSKKPSPSPAS